MDEIERLEARIADLREQMNILLSKISITPAQKEAIRNGHQWAIEEVQKKIDTLKNGGQS